MRLAPCTVRSALVLIVLGVTLASPLLSTTATEAEESAATPVSCAAADCHPGMDNGGHPKKIACAACHDAAAEEGDHPVAKRSVQGTACLGCHTMKKRFLHPPAAAADCTVCHQLHGGTGELLRQEKKRLCFGCHLDFDKGDQAHYHSGGDFCNDCHEAHGAPRQDLLKKPYDTTAYLPFSEKSYALCFDCHQVSLLQFPDTSFYTGFRHGRRNLHFLHVNKKNRGRNCLFCHDVHGTIAPKLIAETVPYGQWTMPIDFRLEENGGSCFPGCHGPRNYDRTFIPPEGTAPASPTTTKPDDQLLQQQRPEPGSEGQSP